MKVSLFCFYINKTSLRSIHCALCSLGWSSQNVQLQQNLPVHKRLSLRQIQSSEFEAPVTRSIPVEVVAPNTVPRKSLNASKSKFSLSRNYVKGGFSSSYEPISHTQSAPSILDGTSSLLKLLGSSSPSAQNVVRQDSYSWSPQDGSGLQGVSSPLPSTPERGGSPSALSVLSPVGSQLAASPQYVQGQGSGYGLPVQPPGATSQYAPALSLGAKKMSSQYYQATRSGSLSPSQSSHEWQPSITKTQGFQASSKAVSRGSDKSQSIIWAPSRFSSLQPQSTSSQNALAPFGAKGPVYGQAALSGFSLSLSQPSQLHLPASRSQSFQTSGAVASQSSSPSQGFKAPSRLFTSASPGQFASTQEGSVRFSGLSIQSPSTSSQYSPESSRYTKLAASPLGVSQSTSGHGSYSQYTSSSQNRAGAQLVGSNHYAPVQTGSTSTDGSSLRLQGTSGQYTPLNAKAYSRAAPSGLSLSPSQSSQWQPSSRWSQGFQNSDKVALQSSSPSQGFKAPSRICTSAASLGPFASTQEGSVRHSGLSIQSPSTSSQNSPESSRYTTLVASPLCFCQSTSGHCSNSQYTTSSQNRGGIQLAGSSHYEPVQTRSTSTDGSSLRLQSTSGQYTPLNAKVYSRAAPSGPTIYPSQSSQWQPSSRWLKGFQTSGTVASKSSSPSRGFKAPSRFSTSAVRSGQLASTQKESGGYSGLFGLSQSASTRHSTGSPAYTKRGSSLLDVSSQSASGPSSYSQSTLSSQRRAGTQLAGSSPYVPVQSLSTFSDGSSLLQGTSTQYLPAALDAKMPAYSQTAPSGSLSQWQPSSRWSQGFQNSDTVASQLSSPSQGSKEPNKFSTLSSAASPGHFSDKYSGLLSLSRGTSSQYSPGSSGSAKRGSSLEFSSQSKSDPSSTGLYASSSQRMAGTRLADSSSYVPAQAGSTFTGASLQFQGTSNQYAPPVSSQYTRASPSESLIGSEAFQKWQPPASPWSQWFQASGTAVPQSSSSPQSAQTSRVSTFLPALSPSVAQSSISSSRRTSVFDTGFGPSKLSAQAASGSTVRSQISPGLSDSIHHPSGSIISSLGSSVQGALQGTFSGQSSDSTSLIFSSSGSTYGQKASGSSRPSQSSSATEQYSSSVKG